jgi:hypothetical protein
MNWESNAKQKYDQMLEKIPTFHKSIAREVVSKGAEENAKARGAGQVEEDDIVKAFYTEVPACFLSMMVRLMDMVGLDHSKFDK